MKKYRKTIYSQYTNSMVVLRSQVRRKVKTNLEAKYVVVKECHEWIDGNKYNKDLKILFWFLLQLENQKSMVVLGEQNNIKSSQKI